MNRALIRNILFLLCSGISHFASAQLANFGNLTMADGLYFPHLSNKSVCMRSVHPYSYGEPLLYEQLLDIFEKAGEYWMNMSTTDGGYQRDMGEVRVGCIFEGQWHFLDSIYVVLLNHWNHITCTYDYNSFNC